MSNHAEAYELVDAGQGRWDVQRRGTLIVAGQLLRVSSGVQLLDWLDNSLGMFRSVDDALRHLAGIETSAGLRHAS